MDSLVNKKHILHTVLLSYQTVTAFCPTPQSF